MSNKHTCPLCNSEKVEKVIACGLPMKFCTSCNCLWGFWSYIYTLLIAPIEAWLNGGFYFLSYKGSYLKALWDFILGRDQDE